MRPKPEPKKQLLENGEIGYFYSYNELREWLMENEINEMMNEGPVRGRNTGDSSGNKKQAHL